MKEWHGVRKAFFWGFTHRHCKGVAKTSNRICNMPWKLNPMTINTASRNYSEAIIESHAWLSKNSSQDVPDYTSYSVSSENLGIVRKNWINLQDNFKIKKIKTTHVQSIIVTCNELDLSCKIAQSARHNAEQHRSGCGCQGNEERREI